MATFDPAFDQISATTLADLKDDIVYDCFFVDTALQRKLRLSGGLDEFAGGTVMQTPFFYNRVNGGAIPPGSDVNVAQVQIMTSTAFVPKEYVEQVPLNLWQTNVLNNGPAAKVKIVDGYMQNAVQAMNTDLAIDFFRHGQAQSTGYISTNRSYFINGASEALNDGVTNSWDGNVFQTYGGIQRNGAVQNSLNSVPVFVGATNGSTGPITYPALTETYWNGVQEPDIGVTNKAAYSYIQNRIAPQQRFRQEVDVTIGMTGLKINNAYVFVDKLCPSTKFGSLLPPNLSQTTAVAPTTFTSSAAPSSISNLPANTSITPGEVFFWFRAAGWKVRPAVDDEYNFNFTPPIRSQNNPDLVVMFLKSAINFYSTNSRDNTQIYGIGS
jgi:hypothetical protein